MEWLKADFHLHTNDCVFDGIPHSACQLIDHAARLGFRVLALTNHLYLIFSECWREYALEKGIILLPGVEAQIQGRHVLIINATREVDRLRTFEDLKAYRRMHDIVVIAPHPFYPGLICLRQKLRENVELFDAIEYNSFYTAGFNPNLKAVRFAQENGLPVLGGSDTHRLGQLGWTYSLLQADLTSESVLDAVRQSRVSYKSAPMRTLEAMRLAIVLQANSKRMDLRRFLFPSSLQCPYRPGAPVPALSASEPALEIAD